jgi:putative glycosyltransferase
MSRRYVESLLAYREREVFLAGLWHITGYEQQPHLVRKQSSSDTTYTIARKIGLLVRSVTAFSNAPLVGIFYAGVCISAGAMAYIIFLTVNWLFFAKPQSGWTSVIASVWLLGGITNVFIGIVGIYLSKIFTEVKQRPYTTIRQIHGQRAE